MVQMHGHANSAEGDLSEAIVCCLTSKEKRQSSTTTEVCVLAVPCLADDSHLHPPSQRIYILVFNLAYQLSTENAGSAYR